MGLPLITIKFDNNMYGMPMKGNLVYQYSPFQNLQNPSPSAQTSPLLGLSINSEKAGINITEPVELETEVSYDDSVNLVITDNVNPPKIVNSRFYQTSTMAYEIADRRGNLDTNIYSEEHFKSEAGLIKTVRTITTVDFLGVENGGIMPVGNYTFYFKLADADGNETDFMAESGKVVCYIGTINNPQSIRGGQQDENSDKLIKFKLNNLDLAYDYINVYYTRSTGDGEQSVVRAYHITDNFKITNDSVEIAITGYEVHEGIDVSEINTQYAVFDSVKTIANCQNFTFAGSITNDYELYKTLEKYSLLITPELAYDEEGIGNLTHDYVESLTDIGYEYYNPKNIYYKLGYWDEEIYRFGIIYILNNYTLSPAFNIRGKKVLQFATTFTDFQITDTININEDYILENTVGSDNPENSKGIFKIDCDSKEMFHRIDSIKPIGIKFNFTNGVIDGKGLYAPGLKDLTKGFFIVRQKRIPTILAQAIGIGTSTKSYFPVIKGTKSSNYIFYNYFSQSFVKPTETRPILGSDFFKIDNEYVVNNALLCPEASVRRTTFNTFFNSSEFLLRNFKYLNPFKTFTNPSGDQFYLGNLEATSTQNNYVAELTLIEPGIDLLRDNKFYFSSKAGDATVPYKHSDPIRGDYEDVGIIDEDVAGGTGVYEGQPTRVNDWNTTTSKVRGEFNTYIGTSVKLPDHGSYYNIFIKDYNYELKWLNYFLLRYNDSSPFFPVSDRIEWGNLTDSYEGIPLTTSYRTDTMFRGDCYINTYTHRMHWNFIDPEMPTNKRIVDPFTWAKNFKITTKASTIINLDGTNDESVLTYRKLLLLFTYKRGFLKQFDGEAAGDTDDDSDTKILEPGDRKFDKYSKIYGLFGAEKINRPDVNAVPLGHWATFKICSNVNLALRDYDMSQPMEEAVHRHKRAFYPFEAMDPHNHLPESSVINEGISKTTGDKYYYELPEVPFIKTNFSTRIHYSNILQNESFTNGNRVFESQNYQDYTKEYGSITRLLEWYGRLVAVMEHGVIMIPVNERAAMANVSGESVYINTENVLPKNPKVLSNTFGSIWPESVIKTARYIYGIDTVGKKIWRTNGESFQNISDLKIQKFLNDHINLKESDKDRTIGINFVKSHYNAFKQDVIFVFKYGQEMWNLCWNELSEKWVTQYTWFPEFSENINNIFYTFANQSKHIYAENKLYKHGFAGTEEELGKILPTTWYDEQQPFEYEFVVAAVPGVQKIFNNLKIISNLTEPDSFYYEIVGEGFDWYKYKTLIMQLNDTSLKIVDGVDMTGISTVKNETNVQDRYKKYLIEKPTIKKLPYIYAQSFDINDPTSFYRTRPDLVVPFNMSVLRDLTIREHNKTREKLIDSYQKGADIKQYGRVKGNMQYLEDAWDVQIQSIIFPYVYIVDQTLTFTSDNEMKIRDKYIKIRVKYKGNQYAIINALRTLFTISHA